MINDDDLTLIKEISAKGARSILHFTNLINLYSIWRCGFIFSRQRLAQMASITHDDYAIDAVCINDQMRLDGMMDYINCSLNEINYSLLKRFIHEERVDSKVWCIIHIDIKHLLSSTTLFSRGNAASKSAKTAGFHSGIKGFRSIFWDGLQNKIVPQSEILIHGYIPVGDITGITFFNVDDRDTAIAALRTISTRALPVTQIDSTAIGGVT